MTRERARRTNKDGGGDSKDVAMQPGTTGRYLVLLDGDRGKDGVGILERQVGFRIASSSDVGDMSPGAGTIESGGGVVFEELGVAVVDGPPDQIQALGVANIEHGAILAYEPERIVYAFEGPDFPRDGGVARDLRGLRGYRDAVDTLVDRTLAELGPVGDLPAPTARLGVEESAATWGLLATRVLASASTGRGIRIAILDTGIALDHPDFARAHDRHGIVRQGGDCGRWARPRDPLRGDCLRPGEPGTITALRGGAGRRLVRRQGSQQSWVRDGCGCPRGYQLGGAARLPCDLPLAGRPDTPRTRRFFARFRADGATCLAERRTHRGRRGQRERPSGPGRSGLASGELSIDHGRGGGRRPGACGLVLMCRSPDRLSGPGGRISTPAGPARCSTNA